MTSPKKAPRVSVRKNVWDNYGCFIGSRKALDFGSIWDAKIWLAGQVMAGATISPASHFTAADVEKYKAFV